MKCRLLYEIVAWVMCVISANGWTATNTGQTRSLQVQVSQDNTSSTAPRLWLRGKLSHMDGSPITSASLRVTRIPRHYEPSEPAICVPGGETSATAQGHFQFAVQDADHLCLSVIAPNCAVAGANVSRGSESAWPHETSAGQRLLTFDLKLPKPRLLTGRVIDDYGKLVPGTTITVGQSFRDEPVPVSYGRSGSHFTTSGLFVLNDVPAGDLRLSVLRNGYLPCLKDVASTSSQNLELVLATTGAEISGTVVSGPAGEAVSSATVVLTYAGPIPGSGKPTWWVGGIGGSKETDQHGMFQFSMLPAGKYLLSASADGLASVDVVPGRMPDAITVGEKETTITQIVLMPALTMQGRITEKGTHLPIAGVEITGQSFGFNTRQTSTTTDADGRFVLTNLPPPSANCPVQAKAIKPGWRLSQKGAGNSIQVYPVVGQRVVSVDAEMEREIVASGIVVDPEGNPVPGAAVTTQYEGGGVYIPEVRSGDDGRFSIPMPAEFRVVFVAAVSGYVPSRSKLLVSGLDAVDNVRLQLSSGATVSGTVSNPEGQPMAGAEIIYLYKNNDSNGRPLPSTKSDPAGKFKLTAILPVTGYIRAALAGYAPSENMELDLSTGDTDDVKLALRKSHSIAGKITDTSGTPILNAHVSSGGGQTKSDALGNYQINDIADGLIDISVNASGYSGTTIHKVEVGRRDADIRLELNSWGNPEKPGEFRPASITGRVVDWKTDKPLTAFHIQANGQYKVTRSADVAGQFTVQGAHIRSAVTVDVTAEGFLAVKNYRLKLGNNIIRMGPGGSLTGRVVTGADHHPAASAEVFLLDADPSHRLEFRGRAEAKKTTGPDGRFTFENLEPGECYVAAAGPQVKIASGLTAVVQHAESTDIGDLTLSGGSKIHVSVIRKPGGEKLPATEVKLHYFPPSHFAVEQEATPTADNETKVYSGLSAGFYVADLPKLKVRKELQLKPDEIQKVDLEVGSTTLEGIVTWRGQKLGAEFVVIEPKIGPSAWNAKSDGSYTVTGLHAGNYRLSIHPIAPDHLGNDEQLEITQEGITEKNFELPSGGIIGNVENEEGKSIPGASISFYPSVNGNSLSSSHQPILSRTDGTFRIQGIRSGQYKVSARGPRGERITGVSVDVTSDSDIPVTLKFTPAGGTVVARLKDTLGAPLQNGSVDLHPKTGAAIELTNIQAGTLQVSGVPAGSYMAKIRSYGYLSIQEPVNVKAGETVTIERTLGLGGAVSVTVLGPDDLPVLNKYCSIKLEGGKEGILQTAMDTNADGKFRYTGLASGPYVMTITIHDVGQVTEPFDIKGEETTYLRTKLEPLPK